MSGGFSVAGKAGEENKNLTNVGGDGGITKGLPAIVALSENASSTTRSGISGALWSSPMMRLSAQRQARARMKLSPV